MSRIYRISMTDLNGAVSFGGGGDRSGGGGGGSSGRQQRRNDFHRNRDRNRTQNGGGRGVTIDPGTTVDVGRGLGRLVGGHRGAGRIGSESGPFCRDCSYTIPNSGPR